MLNALVTGAGQRLGGSIAIYLAKRGFNVAIHYASSQIESEQVANEVRELQRTAIALQADLLSETDVQNLMPHARKALGGPITCLVNNASIFEHDTMASSTRLSWDRHMECNLRAPFVLSQAMASQGLSTTIDKNHEPRATGLIVNMIDQRVRKLTPQFSTYTLSKMGLWALTKTSAQALAPVIRVNGIGPGPTLKGSRQTDAHFQGQRKNTLLQRGANPDEICNALGYFLDNCAVTGQLLCVDGGQHLAWQTPDVLGVE